MPNKSDTDSYNTCSKLLDQGKYIEAVKLAEKISTPAYRAGIFIDGGFALRDSSRVRKGTKIFEDMLLMDEAETGFSKYSSLYNAANGYSSLYNLKRIKGKKVIPPNNLDLRRAKDLYRQTIEILDVSASPFLSQVLVNYGNCLSQTGRFVDAIQCYDRAINIDPTNGMAAGNLGIELEQAMRITGSFRHEYIGLAHDFLQQALSEEMHLEFGSPQAINDFHVRLKRLEEFINAHEEPILRPEPAKNQTEYIRFCIKNGLFLNAWTGTKELTPGTKDDISFGGITTELSDDYLVPELLRILNEIKESYATARYLCFLSQTKSDVLDTVSQYTIYFDNFDYSINGIYTGLSKTAYTRAFDVLDKVARIVNIYFKIGKRKSSFWNIFAEKQSWGAANDIRFMARKAICEKNNLGLYALADLCIDYFNETKVDLKTIDRRRNQITHDYLRVSNLTPRGDSKEVNIELNELFKQTIDVLLLAKYAVIYVVSAVNIAEDQENKNDQRIMPMIYEGKPGDTFIA